MRSAFAKRTCATLIDQFLIEVDEQRGPTGNQRAKSRSASSSDTRREVDLLATFGDSWWRSIGLLARWPVTMEDLAADFLLHSIQPAYFGRRPPLGDGKPIVVVPGGLTNYLFLSNFSLWLKANNYRPTQAAAFDANDQSMDSGLIKTLRTAAESVGRKAVIVAFDSGAKPALQAAMKAPCSVSDVVGFDPPSDLNMSSGAVRLHLIASRMIDIHYGSTLYRTKEWPWLMATNPDALLTLAKILCDIRIELLDAEIGQSA
jgi:hypothetical protein